MAIYKNQDTGTWYVICWFTNWKGERKQKCKRGFPTKRAAADWEREFLMQKQANIDMTLESFVKLYEQDAESEVYEVLPDPILEKLHGWLGAEWTGTATELVQILNLELKPNAFTRYLNVNTGRLENEYGIVYQNTRTHSGRIVSLRRIQPSP